MLLEFLHRHKAGVFMVCFSAFSLLCMALRVSTYVNGAKTCVWFLISPQIVYTGEFFNKLDSTSGRLVGLVRAEAENTILRKQNAELSQREVERDALEVENIRLRNMLDLKLHVFPKSLSAEVIGHELRDGFRSVSLNKGSADGVVISAAVATGSAQKPMLVGRIAEVSEHTCKVLLLSDVLSAISVSVVRTNDMGLLEGQNKPWVKVNYLPHLSSVILGDDVVTAGLGGIFPSGIPVGVVTKINDSKDGFFKEAEVTPYANLGSLRDVLILERREKFSPENPS